MKPHARHTRPRGMNMPPRDDPHDKTTGLPDQGICRRLEWLGGYQWDMTLSSTHAK